MIALIILLILLFLVFGGLGLFVAKWLLIIALIVLLVSILSGGYYLRGR